MLRYHFPHQTDKTLKDLQNSVGKSVKKWAYSINQHSSYRRQFDNGVELQKHFPFHLNATLGIYLLYLRYAKWLMQHGRCAATEEALLVIAND